MNDSDKPDKPHDYEVPCVMHEPMEFDMAADLHLPDVPILRDYSLCTVLHPPLVFDAAEADCLRITLRYEAAILPPDAPEDIASVAHALDRYDRALSGGGLTLAATRSTRSTALLHLRQEPGDHPPGLLYQIVAAVSTLAAANEPIGCGDKAALIEYLRQLAQKKRCHISAKAFSNGQEPPACP